MGGEDKRIGGVPEPRVITKHTPTDAEIEFIGVTVRKFIRIKRERPTGKYFKGLLAIGKKGNKLSPQFSLHQLTKHAAEASRVYMLKAYTKYRAKQASCT